MGRRPQDPRDGANSPVKVSGEGWEVPPVNGLAELHYRYDLADYARGVNSTSMSIPSVGCVATAIARMPSRSMACSIA